MKSKEYAQEKEIERLELAEQDHFMRIAEQKRFEASFGRTQVIGLEPREARLADIEIYKQGNLEY
jgi:hypothetical protein